MEKPDHYENGNQLEENQKEEADETTTNQVFLIIYPRIPYLDLCQASIDGQFSARDITAVIRSEK
jgi:hypothetical protein